MKLCHVVQGMRINNKTVQQAASCMIYTKLIYQLYQLDTNAADTNSTTYQRLLGWWRLLCSHHIPYKEAL